jgi:hypothetical protein
MQSRNWPASQRENALLRQKVELLIKRIFEFLQ